MRRVCRFCLLALLRSLCSAFDRRRHRHAPSRRPIRITRTPHYFCIFRTRRIAALPSQDERSIIKRCSQVSDTHADALTLTSCSGSELAELWRLRSAPIPSAACRRCTSTLTRVLSLSLSLFFRLALQALGRAVHVRGRRDVEARAPAPGPPAAGERVQVRWQDAAGRSVHRAAHGSTAHFLSVIHEGERQAQHSGGHTGRQSDLPVWLRLAGLDSLVHADTFQHTFTAAPTLPPRLRLCLNHSPLLLCRVCCLRAAAQTRPAQRWTSSWPRIRTSTRAPTPW